MEMPNFNSIEEIKEFISSTDSKSIGAISFMDSEGKMVNYSIEEFIKKVGLDKASEFIYEASKSGKMKSIGFTKDELLEILSKFKKDPNSLTEEEKTILYLAMNGTDFTDNETIVKNMLMIIIKSFNDTEIGGQLTSNYSGMLTVFVTLLESALAFSSDDLKLYTDNRQTYEAVIKSVIDQIIIPEGINESCLLLGLINIIGERFIKSESFKNMKVDYHKIAECFELDTEFLFEDEHNDTVTDIDVDITDDLKDNLAKTASNFINSHKSESESKASIVNPNIRESLKKDKNRS